MTRTRSFALMLLAACTAAPSTDELAGETAADDGFDAKSDSPAADAYSYFAIHRTSDGFVLDRLNRSFTICGDGNAASACSATALDWGDSNCDGEAQQKLVDATGQDGTNAIVRGQFAADHFAVSEAWVAESATPAEGVFVKVGDNGTRCITAPCPSLTEKALDTVRSAQISEIDWTMSGLSDGEIAGFTSDLYGRGVIIAGWRYYTQTNGQWTKGRAATAAYHRL